MLSNILTEKLGVTPLPISPYLNSHETEEDLNEMKEHFDEIIKKAHNNPGRLGHFIKQCESSKNLEKDGLKQQD